MIFSEYLRISGANNIKGRCPRWAQPTWARQDPQARPGGLWSPRGPPHLSLHPTSSPTSRKNHHCSLSRVLALKPADFDLFARSSVSETVSGDCVTPPCNDHSDQLLIMPCHHDLQCLDTWVNYSTQIQIRKATQIQKCKINLL